uniref:Uncharacterized protein n=1 Tax=Anguilla anguilla TaxID=7936 RepID=A0A0E9X3D0_ANGAN
MSWLMFSFKTDAILWILHGERYTHFAKIGCSKMCIFIHFYLLIQNTQRL